MILSKQEVAGSSTGTAYFYRKLSLIAYNIRYYQQVDLEFFSWLRNDKGAHAR